MIVRLLSLPRLRGELWVSALLKGRMQDSTVAMGMETGQTAAGTHHITVIAMPRTGAVRRGRETNLATKSDYRHGHRLQNTLETGGMLGSGIGRPVIVEELAGVIGLMSTLISPAIAAVDAMTGPHVMTGLLAKIDLPARIDLPVRIGPHEMIDGDGRSEMTGDTIGTAARGSTTTVAARVRRGAAAAPP